MATKTTTKTPLDKATIKRLSAVGIEALSEEGARAKLLKKLAENDIDNVDEDPLDDLIDMYKQFHEEPEAEAEEEAADDEEAAEEASEETEEEGHEEEEEYDEAAEEVEEEETAEEEAEEEDEDEKPAKATAKPAVKPGKPQVGAAAKATAKPAVAKAPKTVRVKGAAWNKDNEAHVKMIQKPFVKNEDYSDLEFKMLKQGFTAYEELTSAKRALFSYDRVKITDKGLVGDLFFNALKGKEEVEEHVDLGDLDREFKNFNPNLIFVPRVSPEEANAILANNDLLAHMRGKVEAADKKAVAARKKMEEKMKEGEKKPAPAAKVAPKAAPAPVKKAAPAPVAAKKPVKK